MKERHPGYALHLVWAHSSVLMFMFVKKANIPVTVCSMGHSNMIKYLSHPRKLQFCVEVFLHFWAINFESIYYNIS